MTDDASASRLELIGVILLSITAILTAWTAFQSSKWGGAMSISFAQASTARIEAARYDGLANRMTSVQVTLFTQWSQADAEGDQKLADFYEEQFPEPLKTAFAAWQQDPTAGNPFSLPEYQIPASQLAQESDALADAKYQEALDNNQRGDNYTILTVLFASVLFFAAMSGRVKASSSQVVLLSVAGVLFVVAVGFLIAFPKLI
ncbi:MAG TPA: hypothetical protein PLQ14_11915 [Actinomycetota bacterium]|nr:hypothetical protein [Actinomycetota bacterium]HRV67632.1 hypothetical protein [Candidatus Nanopelagicales bacterium]